MLSVTQLSEFTQQQSPAMLVVSVVLGALLVNLFAKKTSKTYTYPQPSSTLPLLGNTVDVVFHNHRLYDWFADQCLALDGPWLLSIVGSVPTLTVSTPELFEDVLKTQFDVFEKGSECEFLADLFDKGILASDDDQWFFHRKTASNLFSNQMMRDVMYKAVEDKVATLCGVLQSYESKGHAVSFKNVITQFTSDVFGKIGFGVDLDCLENGIAGKKGNEFVDAFHQAAQVTFLRFVQPEWLWRLKRVLNVGSEKLLKESVQVIDQFIFRIINESIAKKNVSDQAIDNKTAAVAPPKDLISLFLNSSIKEEENVKGKAFDSEMHLIRDTVVNFIFAGKDTTSHSMSFFIVMMNRYPEVLKKVRAELNEKLPGLASGAMAVPSMDDLPQLTYLEAAIRENLRLNPVLPLGGRRANKDTVLCDGTPIAKYTLVGPSIYAAARRTSVWSEDALEFKPERWIDPVMGKLLVVSPFKASFFFGGPRQCIGMKFAMMELKSTLAVLLSKFDFKTVEDPWSLMHEVALTMSVKGPLLVKVTPLGGKSSGGQTRNT